MPIKPSADDRSGYEYFTKELTVRKIEREYRSRFMDADIIWLPFNSEDKPIYKILSDIYGNGYGKQVITNPRTKEWYNEELGCYDFWEWYNDKNFVRMILTQKVLVFDNPPFKGATSVMRCLLNAKKQNPNLNFILFSDAMTGMNKVTSLHKDGGVGYHILGNVEFDNAAPDKRISIALFSNLFKEIKFVYGLGIDPRDKHGIQYWSQRCNLEKYRDERNGEISSAEMINVCARGYVFKLDRFDFTQKCVKFGGCAKYRFETDEEIKEFNKKHALFYNF
jgi:hypothetical protein